MPKVYPFKLNFTSGEISPKLMARVDLNQYKGGCETMENFIPYPHGGARFRPGFHFVKETKDSSKLSRLIPFQFSREQAYILEFGDYYIRFYKDRGQIVGDELTVSNHDFETAGGGGADVFANWTENAGTGAIADGGATEAYRGSSCLKMTCGASDDTYIYSDNIDVSSMATGESFSVKFWTKGDGSAAGRYSVYDVTNSTFISTEKTSTSITDEYWTQVTYTGTIPAGCVNIRIYFYPGSTNGDIAYFDHVQLLDNTLPVEITSPYGEDDLEYLQWTQSADTLYLVHPDYAPRKLLRYSHEDWELVSIDLTGPNSITNGEFDADAVWVKGSGWTISAGVASGSTASGNLSQTNVLEAGMTYTVRFTIANYSAGSVKPMCGSGGSGTSRSSNGTFEEDIVCSGSLDFYLDGTGFTGDIDSVEVASHPFNSKDNYPRSVTFHEERLFFAGTNNYPQKLWGSKSGDYENLTTGTYDDDAVVYTIASDQVNVIEWMVPSTALIAGTAGGEFRIKGGADDILTPSSVQAKSVSTIGVAENIKALRIGHLIIFPQTARRKLIELKYSFEEDSWVGHDLTLISEHITEGGIIDMVYQQEPDSLIWCVRDDGVLLSMTYQRDQEVVAWARHEVAGTNAEVESICSVPAPDGGEDDLWAVIKLTIDGGTVRYVEYLDDEAHGMDHFIKWDGDPATTFTGADHLEGETVAVIGDGALYPDEVVSSGQFTVDEAASILYAGIQYEGTLKTLRPEVEMQGGHSYGLTKSWNIIKIMVYETVGGEINGETLLLIDPEQEMGTAPDPYTGTIDITEIGWDEEGQITIVQDEPFPFIILAVTGSLTIAEEM